MEESHTLFHGLLEGLSSQDEAGATCSFIDDGGAYCFGEVVGAGGCATGVDESGAPHVTVGHLVSR